MNNPPSNSIDAKHLISRRISRPYDYMRGGMSHLLRLFTVISGAGETPVVVQINHDGEEKQFSFEEIVSMVWTLVKRDQEAASAPVAAAGAGLWFNAGNAAVVILEDFMHDGQRQAAANAAAGDGVDLHIINNPVCASIAYALDKKPSADEERNVLVYNHGGDDLTVAVLTIEEGGVFSMRSAARETQLNGDKFTNRLLNHFAAEFNRKHKKDLTAASLRRLRAACERAKRALSWKTQTTIEIDSLYEGIDFYGSITRSVFESLTMDLLLRSQDIVEECSERAHVSGVRRLADMVLVGGTSKIPKLQKLLADLVGGENIRKNIDPVKAIAFGAHLLCKDTQLNRVAKIRFLDFMHSNIGIKIGAGGGAGAVEVLIAEKTVIPAKTVRFLTTCFEAQSDMQIRLYHGTRVPMDTSNSSKITERNWRIPVAPQGTPRVKLRIEIEYLTLSVWIMDNLVFETTNLWGAPR
ncbi:hypothetical protein ABFX02_04G112400 [Erythranthe guttata]